MSLSFDFHKVEEGEIVRYRITYCDHTEQPVVTDWDFGLQRLRTLCTVCKVQVVQFWGESGVTASFNVLPQGTIVRRLGDQEE